MRLTLPRIGSADNVVPDHACPGRGQGFAVAHKEQHMTAREAGLNYFRRMWELRYFWMSLVRNDLNNRYKRSFLGIGWSLLKPLSMTLVFCVVFANLFRVPVADYAPFLLIGMTMWQFLTECLIHGVHSFARGSPYIRQQSVPLAIFPLRVMLGSGIHALIALGVSLFVTLFFQGYLNPVGLLYLVPALVLLVVLGWAAAVLTGIMYTYFPDTSQILEIVLQILFYATPIMYRPELFSGRTKFAALLQWNPLTSVLALIRTPILEGTMPAFHQIAIAVTFVAIMTALAVLVLRKLERTLILWI
jgi:lipopolysaccharide transport system permease protein